MKERFYSIDKDGTCFFRSIAKASFFFFILSLLIVLLIYGIYIAGPEVKIYRFTKNGIEIGLVGSVFFRTLFVYLIWRLFLLWLGYFNDALLKKPFLIFFKNGLWVGGVMKRNFIPWENIEKVHLEKNKFVRKFRKPNIFIKGRNLSKFVIKDPLSKNLIITLVGTDEIPEKLVDTIKSYSKI